MAGLQSSNPWTKKLERVLSLTDDDRTVLDQLVSRTRKYEAGEVVVQEATVPSLVHIVLDGCLARHKLLSDGRRQNTALLLPGDLWDLNVFLRTEITHSISATVPSLVANIPRDDFLDAVHSRPMLTTALWWNALHDEAVLREWVVNVGARKAEERIAHLIYEIYVRLEVVGRTTGCSFYLPLTQSELGETTGMSAVHVNRTLQSLRKKRLIVLEGRMLTLPDPQKLKEIAEFDPRYLKLAGGGGTRYGGPELPLID